MTIHRGYVWRRRASSVVLFIVLSLLVVPVIFPIIWMISSSLKPLNEILDFPPRLIPENIQWDNYVEIFRYQPFARHFLNSMMVSVVVTTVTLFVSSMAGYAFARLRFRGSSILFLGILGALMLPIEVTIVPTFTFMSRLGLVGTHIPIILLQIFALNAVIGTFIMRQFYLHVPRELEEAGMMDGLTRFGVFRRIALPLSTPALAAVGILTFWASWNAFLEPLVFLDDLETFTLPLSLTNFSDVYGTPLWNLQLAATTLTVLPVLLVYVFARKQVNSSFVFQGADR